MMMNKEELSISTNELEKRSPKPSRQHTKLSLESSYARSMDFADQNFMGSMSSTVSVKPKKLLVAVALTPDGLKNIIYTL